MNKLADNSTDLSGDDVKQDDVERLIITLRKHGVIEQEQMVYLHHGYLKEVYSDNEKKRE